jgi:adenosylcobinamide-GDP ribazoletransferase
MAYYPLVGFFVGLVLVGANQGFSPFLPRPVVAILLVIILASITGGLHLDGFCDTIDGLTSGKSREDMLRIMRDSRVGAFGVVGLMCLLMFQFVLLVEIPAKLLSRSLLLMAILSRWTMVQVAYRSIYARPEGGLGKPFVERLGARELLIATVLVLVFAGALFGLQGVLILVLDGLLGYAIRQFFHRKLGGITGDVLGATNEITEVFSLTAVLILGT